MANPFLVLGGVAIGIVVAAFGVLQVPGWVTSAQDAAAINDMRIVHDTQAARSATEAGYASDIGALRASDESGVAFELSSPDRVTYLGVSAEKDAWCGVVRSDSGQYFGSSNKNPITKGAPTIEGATLLAGCENGSGGKFQANTIVFRLDTRLPGCTSPGVSPNGHRGDVRITWGDGSKSAAAKGMNGHNYANPGIYDVTVEGTVPSWSGLWPGAAKCIVEVPTWGETGTKSTYNMFASASNLKSVAKPPAGIEDMRSMFNGASTFNGDISDWNVEEVKTMDSMFSAASAFNQDLNDWKVGKVENFGNMFASAYAFNGDISDWDTKSAKTLTGMFANNRSFTGDISRWNTENVTSLLSTFANSSVFNSDLSGWNLTKVKNMNSAFNGAKGYYGDLSKWKTPGVEDMTRMFMLSKLTYNLSGWDVSSVTKSTDFGKSSTLAGLPVFKN